MEEHIPLSAKNPENELFDIDETPSSVSPEAEENIEKDIKTNDLEVNDSNKEPTEEIRKRAAQKAIKESQNELSKLLAQKAAKSISQNDFHTKQRSILSDIKRYERILNAKPAKTIKEASPEGFSLRVRGGSRGAINTQPVPYIGPSKKKIQAAPELLPRLNKEQRIALTIIALNTLIILISILWLTS